MYGITVRSRAKSIVDLYSDEGGITDVYSLCSSLGIKISSDAEVTDSAVCVYNERKNKYIIFVNPNREEQEKYIAHELGHIVLGHFKDGKLVSLGENSKKKYNEKEIQADSFAEELLIIIEEISKC